MSEWDGLQLTSAVEGHAPGADELMLVETLLLD